MVGEFTTTTWLWLENGGRLLIIYVVQTPFEMSWNDNFVDVVHYVDGDGADDDIDDVYFKRDYVDHDDDNMIMMLIVMDITLNTSHHRAN